MKYNLLRHYYISNRNFVYVFVLQCIPMNASVLKSAIRWERKDSKINKTYFAKQITSLNSSLGTLVNNYSVVENNNKHFIYNFHVFNSHEMLLVLNNIIYSVALSLSAFQKIRIFMFLLLIIETFHSPNLIAINAFAFVTLLPAATTAK